MPSPQLQASLAEDVISHDRWLLDRIATHMLAFEGNYQDYEKDYKRRKGADADQPHRIKCRRIDA